MSAPRLLIGPLAALALFALAGQAHAQPDLQMNTWSVSPGSVPGAGSTVTITFSVRNAGSVASGAFAVTFYYGDTTSTTGLTTLATRVVTGIPAGANSATLVQTVTMPASVLYGTRYLHYFVDSTNAVVETDETNNRGYTTIGITGQPDLQVTVLAIFPTTAGAGTTVTVYYRIANMGLSRVGSPFTTRFYYSDDATITTGDTYLNQEVTVSSLNAQAYYPPGGTGTTTVVVPSSVLPGTRYIGAYADYAGAITESVETNNTRAASFNVPYPDLYMYSWSLSASSVTGYTSPVTVTFQVRNSGPSAAGGFNVYFYYSDTTSTTGMTYLGSAYLSGLSALTTSTAQQATVTMPANVLYGTRYLHYFVDALNSVTELNENNNRGYTTLGITGLPDLVFSYFAVSPTSTAPGAAVTITYRLRNQGYSRADAFTTRFYYSTDATISPAADTYLNQQVALGSLYALSYYPPLANTTVGVTVPTTATPGSAYLGGYADYAYAITEALETNNASSAAITVLKATGTTCSATTECLTGYCVDGVCCNSACGGSNTADCQACSTTAGASANGTCAALPSTRQCRASTGACDPAESCTGTSTSCPIDAYSSSGTVCRQATGACDQAETCSGSSASCPSDGVKTSGTVCRATAGTCDVAESCDGSTKTCPNDAFQSSTTVCRATAGVCDVAESCSGTSATCPTDGYLTSTTQCRAAVGECDLAEACTGLAATCPSNVFKTNGTTCTGGWCVSGVCSSVPPPDAGADKGIDGGKDKGAPKELGPQPELGPTPDLKPTTDKGPQPDGVAKVDAKLDGMPKADGQPMGDGLPTGDGLPVTDGQAGGENVPVTDGPTGGDTAGTSGEDGCSCKVGSSEPGLPVALLGLTLLLVGIGWRRRRR